MQEAATQHTAENRAASIGCISVSLAPHIFIRTSGLSFASSMISNNAAATALTHLLETQHRKNAVVNLACDRLEQLVPSGFETHAKVGRGLISLKRDLYNSRTKFAEQNEDIVSWLAVGDRRLVDEARQAIDCCQSAHAKFDEAHRDEIAQTRTAVLYSTQEPILLAGLTVINPSLYDTLHEVQTERRELSAKDYNQLSASVMRYLLRISRKTSPIATFGPVWTAGWDDESSTGQKIEVPEVARHTISVRAALVQRLMHRLLQDLQNMSGDAPIVLNPTLKSLGSGGYEWWVRKFGESAGSILAGAELERVSGRSPAIAAIRNLFQAASRSTMTFDELRERMASGSGENVAERIDRAIGSAWRSQLLLPVLHDHDDALVWASEVADLLKEDLADALRGPIDALAKLGLDNHLPTREMTTAFEGHFSLLQSAADSHGKDVPKPVITVDAHAGDPGGRHPSLQDSLVATLSTIVRAMPALAADTSSAQMRRKLYRFLDERHASSTGKERLASFIQAYYDAGGETQSELFQSSMGLAPAAEQFGSDPIGHAGNALLDELARKSQSGSDVKLSSLDLDKALSSVPHLDADYLSLQFHIQPVGAGQSYVLNQIFPGSCSTLTRFLSKESGQEQREYLNQTLGGRIPLEINASFGFNASAHPRLADFSLSVPPIPDRAGIQSLGIDSLWVERGPRPGDMKITDLEGREYAPIYIAALNPMSLPKQYQVLHALSVNHWRHSGLSGPIIRRAMEGFDGFRALSRITIDDLVVLRRTWLVSPEGLPDLGSSPAEFFRSFNIWADEKALPLHLFYQANVFPLADGRPSSSGKSGSRGPRLYKPMPLDRKCALGVELFRQAATKSSLGLLISEALPTPLDESYTRGGAPIAAELAVEITCSRSSND